VVSDGSGPLLIERARLDAVGVEGLPDPVPVLERGGQRHEGDAADGRPRVPLAREAAGPGEARQVGRVILDATGDDAVRPGQLHGVGQHAQGAEVAEGEGVVPRHAAQGQPGGLPLEPLDGLLLGRRPRRGGSGPRAMGDHDPGLEALTAAGDGGDDVLLLLALVVQGQDHRLGVLRVAERPGRHRAALRDREPARA